MLLLFYISGLRRLEKPVLILNITKTSPGLYNVGYTDTIAALPGGGAVVRYYINNNKTGKILKINSQGKVLHTIYTCVGCSSYIFGLLVLGDHLYLTHNNGTVIKTRVSDGRVLSRSTIPDVKMVMHTRSLYREPGEIHDKQTLLLCDREKGEVFTFIYSTGQKKVRITGLIKPTSVSYFFHNQNVFYIVCEGWGHKINVYNQTWDLIRTIGTNGYNDGELNYPQSAIVSNEDTIIISDLLNHRISEFSFNGTFLRHLLDSSDGINRPLSMSFYYPHLWLTYGGYPHNKSYRYNLYR